MTSLSKENIQKALSAIVDPHTSVDLVDGGAVTEIQTSGLTASVSVTLGYPAQGWHDELKRLVTEAI